MVSRLRKSAIGNRKAIAELLQRPTHNVIEFFVKVDLMQVKRAVILYDYRLGLRRSRYLSRSMALQVYINMCGQVLRAYGLYVSAQLGAFRQELTQDDHCVCLATYRFYWPTSQHPYTTAVAHIQSSLHQAVR